MIKGFLIQIGLKNKDFYEKYIVFGYIRYISLQC